MKNHVLLLIITSTLITSCATHKTTPLTLAKNPIIDGWYADPEGTVFNKTYWVFPTYSAKYEQQVFLNAFSSKDLKTWTKHEHILYTSLSIFIRVYPDISD